MKTDGAEENGKIVVNVDPDLEDLIPDFMDNRLEDIKSITEALEKKDFETIRILGHSMKGSGGGYGFDDITKIGGFMERASMESDAEEIKKWVDELSSYLKRVEVVYEQD